MYICVCVCEMHVHLKALSLDDFRSLVAGGLDDKFGCDHRDLAIHVTRAISVAIGIPLGLLVTKYSSQIGQR